MLNISNYASRWYSELTPGYFELWMRGNCRYCRLNKHLNVQRFPKHGHVNFGNKD